MRRANALVDANIPRATSPSRLASIAVASGDLPAARRHLIAATRADRGNAALWHTLGVVHDAMSDHKSAAEAFSMALGLDPSRTTTAHRFADALSLGAQSDKARLSEAGLSAALRMRSIDRDLIGAAALASLAAANPLRGILEHGRHFGWSDIARKLCVEKTHELLKSQLFIDILEHSIVSRRDIELLLTAVRRSLILDCGSSRFSDPYLVRFCVALFRQCSANEYIFSVQADELAKTQCGSETVLAAVNGVPEAGLQLLLAAMYSSIIQLADGRASADQLSRVAPAPIGEALKVVAGEAAEIQARGRALPALSAVENATSRLVASQYEGHPYPRWTSVPLYPDSGYLAHVAGHFKPGQLAFSRTPFEVLIAGCGTGRQAVSAARDYGANANVVGVDISRASLGYASLMADRMGATNLSLAQGDLCDILDFEPTFRDRFHIIECGGVLHHMADPFAAWAKLIQCLAPGGIMLIGLYSRLARRHLAALRSEPGFPGGGVDDATLRAWRDSLFHRPATWAGQHLLRTRDAFSTSGFRDYFLHVNEHTTSLPEIKTFLDAHDLEFRGFVDIPASALGERTAAALDLDVWDAWEQSHPNAFRAMYQFWCCRRGG